MNAKVSKAWSQWFVAPQDGTRGGIAVASRKAALEMCAKRGWTAVDDNGNEINGKDKE